MKKQPLVFLLTTLLTGCATVKTLNEAKIYSGIRADVTYHDDCVNPVKSDNGHLYYRSGEFCIIGLPFVYLDMPFSLVGDTIMLPIKAIQIAVSDE